MKHESRFLRLVSTADRGRSLAEFMRSEEVLRFFAEYEDGCVQAIAECEPNDDEGRRNAGLKLQAMRALVKDIEAAVAASERAQKKIAQGQTDE